MDFKKLNEDLINEIEQFASPEVGKRLTHQAGREYALKGPAVSRITRQDKRALLKEKDPKAVKNAMEQAFKIIIAAAKGTDAQQMAVTKVNMIRTQLFKKLDQMAAKNK